MQEQWKGLDELLAVWLGAHRFRCMGRDLIPFTLLHRELLRLSDHPLMHDRPVDLVNLDLAVRICSVPAWKAGAILRQRPRWWRSWWRALRLVWWARHHERETAVFREYIETCCDMPDVMVAPGDGAQKRLRVVPELPSLFTHLSNEGYNLREFAGEWPAGLTEWIFMVSAGKATDIKFITDRDREFQEGIRRDQRRKAEREAAIAEEDRRTGLSRGQRILLQVTGRDQQGESRNGESRKQKC